MCCSHHRCKPIISWSPDRPDLVVPGINDASALLPNAELHPECSGGCNESRCAEYVGNICAFLLCTPHMPGRPMNERRVERLYIHSCHAPLIEEVCAASSAVTVLRRPSQRVMSELLANGRNGRMGMHQGDLPADPALTGGRTDAKTPQVVAAIRAWNLRATLAEIVATPGMRGCATKMLTGVETAIHFALLLPHLEAPKPCSLPMDPSTPAPHLRALVLGKTTQRHARRTNVHRTALQWLGCVGAVS